MIEVANKANQATIEALQDLPPIKYDGMNCPKCSASTIECAGHVWCPNIACDFGEELKLPDLITKWALTR